MSAAVERDLGTELEQRAAREVLKLLAAFETDDEAGMSPGRRLRFRFCVVQFANSIAPRSVLSATSDEVVAFLATKRPKSINGHGGTANTNKWALHRFFNWARNEGLVARDPTTKVIGHQQLPFTIGDFPELMRGYRLSQERRGLSGQTIVGRSQQMRVFAEWLAPRSLLDGTEDDVETFLDGRHIGVKSRYAYISHLHMFYAWAVRQGLIEVDPTENIVRPKLPKDVPRPISDADLIEALAEAPSDIRAMLALGAYQGMRCIEIAGLQRDDIREHLTPPILIVSAPKGNRQRTLPLHPEALAALRAHGLPRNGPIFRYSDGRQLPPHRVSRIGADYLAELGINATMHQLRHWFGSKLYSTTLDLRMTQEMMGHASPTTTTIYTQFNPGNAVGAVTALTPHQAPDVADADIQRSAPRTAETAGGLSPGGATP